MRPGQTPRRSIAGFTLLEALVAVAILGLTLIPLLTLLSQLTVQLRAAAESNARNAAQQTVMRLVEPINLMEEPIGQMNIGDLEIAWRSEVIVPQTSAIHPGAGLGSYSIGFYKVTVDVTKADRGKWFSFELQKVGYHTLGTSPFLPGTASK